MFELPFGRGKWIGKDLNRWANLAVAGWEYDFIGTIQAGTPVDLPGNVNVTGDPSVDNQEFSRRFNGCVAAINGTAPCANPSWKLRNTNFSLRTTPFRAGWIRGPIKPTWDMSLNKKFCATERINFQFRFEAFHVFNTPIRSNPITGPTRSDFGVVPLGQSNIPRQVQLGFKLNF